MKGEEIYDGWVSTIGIKGAKKYLGYFKDKKEAIRVRKEAESKYGYHPNHGKRKVEII